MLRPQQTSTRDVRCLDGLWSFSIDPSGVGRTAKWWEQPLPESQLVPVPSSYNDVLVDNEIHDHVGDVWYQTDVVVPFGWTDQRVLLRFDAATHRATVWLGDTLIAEHQGGYLPFEADITDLVEPGSTHRLTVCVNNELSWSTIPPGSLETTPTGGRRLRYFHDFFNYSGLHRSVWLHSIPQSHISDITITTDIDGSDGIVHCGIDVIGEGDIHLVLRDPRGAVVAETDGTESTMRVANADLWGPGHGSLHALAIELLRDGQVVDTYSIPVGIRTVEVRGTQFLINGSPFYFRGFGMHEDHSVRGKGHDPANMVHDFALLNWIGANSLRTSHYPYAEEILDHADRLGIVVIDETAAVGLNLGVAGGLMGGPAASTFGDGPIGAESQSALLRDVRDLIARDRNHPSVVMWSVANEPESNSDASRAYFEPVFAAARR